ncbi:hypothetical protein DF268_04310 [Streptomyces sp. V2]|uniref:hypothetical protein n=2 Tax=Streptomyces TaxID=1883 RepID=UPI000D66C8E4|nr:hypothetical protein [Streptomyces sp. V2]PWG14960.1 hypothetical protein DF268_04310 [Streptomyces sp. V2]
MLFGSRAGFGLEFHIERDPGLLCVDVHVGGLHVNARDNAFYPPLLVKKLKDELARFDTPAPTPTAFTSPADAFRLAEAWILDASRTAGAAEAGEQLAGYRFLDWGECTDGALTFAFPDGDRVHLACRVYGDEGPGAFAAVPVSRPALVETLGRGLAVAEREWGVRRVGG